MFCSPKKTRSDVGFAATARSNILVTGSSGLVGARLVEMLLERGASHVVCFDMAPPTQSLRERFDLASSSSSSSKPSSSTPPPSPSSPKYTCVQGDLTSPSSLSSAIEGKNIDTIYHIAALVGPFHDRNMYMKVNFHGTENIINLANENKISRIVMSSSPSTRFTGDDIIEKTEDELPIPDSFLQLYAESKAYGELACRNANCKSLRTIAVAPHQVYGKYDTLFLPNLLSTAGRGLLRVFGGGENLVSFCHVDNYCHGLMCGCDNLLEEFGSEDDHSGKFYIVTDGPAQNFWKVLDVAITAMGFQSVLSKFHLPVFLLMGLGYLCDIFSRLSGKKLKLSVFNVKMLTIHRNFSIVNATEDLKYSPLVSFEEGWASTIDWYVENWLPTWNK